jgi:hypothetical protein
MSRGQEHKKLIDLRDFEPGPEPKSFVADDWMSGFPDDIKSFVKELNIEQNQHRNLGLLLHKIKKLLDTLNIRHEIIPSLFTDIDYPEWEEIQLSIKIKKDLEYIYKKLKPPIYNLVRETVPEKLSNKILINFESF